MISIHMLRYIIVGVVFCTLSSCIDSHKYDPKPYLRPLEIVKLSTNNYLHISYMKLENGNYFPCNGFIYMKEKEAIVFDTPFNDSISSQLITFIQEDLGATIKGVVINHAHEDAAGGVNAFAKANIPSYASSLTADILAKDAIYITHPFEEKQELSIGETIIENRYFGPAHTTDNIVSYIKDGDVLFGGCIIKPLGANHGNIKDADIAAWPSTVTAIKEAYPNVKLVIPGHGGRGDSSLLDYTIDMYTSPVEQVIYSLE